MNSRERVLTTLNHKEPDKVPIDLGGNQSGIHISPYKRLLEALEIYDDNIHFCDYVQQLAQPCEELLNYFEVDIRWLRPPKSLLPETHIPEVEGKYQGIMDQFGVFWGTSADKDLEEIFFFDPVIHPFEDIKTVREIEDYNWPNGKDRSQLKGLRDVAKYLREKTPYAIATPPLGCIYEYTTFLFGFAKVLRLIRKQPELILAAMKELLQYWTDYAITFLNEIKFGDEYYVDIVAINGDLAMENGPILHPTELYVPLIKPIERQLSKKIHELTDVKINYHCCGSIPAFIPHFAEIEYDAINPIQISAYDMEPCSLKNRFGHLITFWGGICDTRETLPFGNPDQIRAEVKYNLACLKPGGGYIASNIHNITAEVPPQNIIAMFEATKTFRNY
ncbi:MAG: uroporphyrinogen decarboxylase family protein [Candidatus Helarchaeota archaeon]